MGSRLGRFSLLLAIVVASAPPAPVRAGDGQAAPAPSPTPQVLQVLGRVQPKPELVADVVAPIWGRIEFVGKPIAVGEGVRKDQPLVRIVLELSADERYLMEARKVEIQSAADSAKVKRQQAEREYRSAVALMKTAPGDPFRQQQVQSTEMLFRAAGEAQDLLERQVRAFDAVIRRRDPRVTVVEAPIAGVITKLGVKPGERNETGAFRNICTIVDLSRVWIEADVLEKDVALVLNGAQASFRLSDTGPSRRFARQVAVLPWIDAKTRTLKVVFEAPNADRQLRLGMTVQVTFTRPATMPVH